MRSVTEASVTGTATNYITAVIIIIFLYVKEIIRVINIEAL